MKMNSLILSMMICSLMFDQISSIGLFKRSMADDYAKQVLDEHNRYRKKHCVDPLILDDEVQRSAQKYAQYLADNDIFKHSDPSVNPYGENMYRLPSLTTIDNFQNVGASASWYDEIGKYDFSQPGYSSSTGHFTQLVWKDSQKLGVGIALTKDGKKAYVVAHYDPPGNYEGLYEDNVLKPNC